MRTNFDKMPYSNVCIGYVCGYYNDEEMPTFNTMDFHIEIKNNHIRWLFAESAYEILDGITEFTLSPTLIVLHDGKARIGVNHYYPKPQNGEIYSYENANMINAPFVEEIPLVMECRITKRNKEEQLIGTYKSVDYELEAEIVNVNIESSFIDEDGEVMLPKMFGLKGFWKFGDDS